MRPTPLFLAAVLILSACGARPDAEPTPGGVPFDAAFLEATTEQRQAAIQAALGLGPLHAILAVVSADADALAGDCPSRTVLADAPFTVHYSAEGCDAKSGVRYDGEAEAVNLAPFNPTPEAGGAMELRVDAFSLTGGFPLWMDGEFRQTESAPGLDYATHTRMTVEAGGQSSTLRSSSRCVWSGETVRCTFDPDASGSVEGLGSFSIEGEFNLIGREGAIVLGGRDRLLMDVAATGADGCAPLLVNDAKVDAYCLELQTP